MIEYHIKWKSSAVKDISSFPKEIIFKIIEIVDSLKNNPFPINSIKLKGTKSSYRIRFSDYRIIYTILKEELIIEIASVGHRKDIYKKK
jgi:mRNA interferase RelE/StbE